MGPTGVPEEACGAGYLQKQMKIIIPDDYQDAVRNLSCFAKLAEHSVSVFTDTVKDTGAIAERLQSADALVLIRERTRISEELLARLPRLKLISQTGKGTAHIDLAACTRRGIVVSAGIGSPFAPAELTWALVLASRRRVAEEAARMRAGFWQSALGKGLRGQTLGIWGYGKIGSLVAGLRTGIFNECPGLGAGGLAVSRPG